MMNFHLPFGYVGLGPGQELIPYFWALLTFMAAAVVAMVQWPIVQLRRMLARGRARGEQRPANDMPS